MIALISSQRRIINVNCLTDGPERSITENTLISLDPLLQISSEKIHSSAHGDHSFHRGRVCPTSVLPLVGHDEAFFHIYGLANQKLLRWQKSFPFPIGACAARSCAQVSLRDANFALSAQPALFMHVRASRKFMLIPQQQPTLLHYRVAAAAAAQANESRQFAKFL
jgi:hypothetical protein